MIGGGEELRAIATANTKTRKQKHYTTVIDFGINPAIGFQVTGSITFERTARFLWTGTTITCMRTNFAARRDLVPTTYLVEFSMPSSGFRPQNVPQIGASVFSDRINEVSDFHEYALFEGNEVLNITLTYTVNPALSTSVYVTLIGIEYRS